jgi:hypothetical protein
MVELLHAQAAATAAGSGAAAGASLPRMNGPYELLGPNPRAKPLVPARLGASSSAFRGVSQQGSRWRARICVDKTEYAIGDFDSEQKAALEYDREAMRRGKLRQLNFLYRGVNERDGLGVAGLVAGAVGTRHIPAAGTTSTALVASAPSVHGAVACAPLSVALASSAAAAPSAAPAACWTAATAASLVGAGAGSMGCAAAAARHAAVRGASSSLRAAPEPLQSWPGVSHSSLHASPLAHRTLRAQPAQGNPRLVAAGDIALCAASSSGVAAPASAPSSAVASEDDPNEDFCAACGMCGELVCCDTCPRALHMPCCGLTEVPVDDVWSCPICSAGAAGLGQRGSRPLVPRLAAADAARVRRAAVGAVIHSPAPQICKIPQSPSVQEARSGLNGVDAGRGIGRSSGALGSATADESMVGLKRSREAMQQ